MTIEIPNVIADRMAEFTPQELDSLRTQLTTPLFLKLLSVAECMKPSARCTGAMCDQRDAFSNDRANARLGEIRGWELHQAAIFAALYPKPKREEATESYQPVMRETEEET